MPNIYRISNEVNNDYDTYDSAIVVADSPEDAKLVHPSSDAETKVKFWDGRWWFIDSKGDAHEHYNSSWCLPADVGVELVGKAAKGFEPGTVICASFNAG